MELVKILYELKLKLQDSNALEMISKVSTEVTDNIIFLYGTCKVSKKILVDKVRAIAYQYTKSRDEETITKPTILLIEDEKITDDELEHILTVRDKTTIVSLNRGPSKNVKENPRVISFCVESASYLTKISLLDELCNKMKVYEWDFSIVTDIANTYVDIIDVMYAAEVRLKHKTNANTSNKKIDNDGSMTTSAFLLWHLPWFFVFSICICIAALFTDLIQPVPLVSIIGLFDMFMITIERGRSENKFTVILNSAIASSVSFITALMAIIFGGSSI